MSRNIPQLRGPGHPPGAVPVCRAGSATRLREQPGDRRRFSRHRTPQPPAPGQGRRCPRGLRELDDTGCLRGIDPELFFPVAVTGAAAGQVSSAKAVCGRCEVGADCLAYALQTMPHGIWGATTREERIAMRVPPAVCSLVKAEGPCA
jgi:WhiB family transcriptional regulator, redox-sensing transcriptional regulator